jgi:hypothetical protein
MIAATALANGLPLYTANPDDLKVPGLSDQLLSPRPVFRSSHAFDPSVRLPATWPRQAESELRR